MIGGLLKIAGTMVAWGATHAATLGTARFLSSRYKRAVGAYIQHASVNTRASTKMARNVLTAVTGRTSASAQRQMLESGYYSAKQRVQSSLKNYNSKLTPKGQKHLSYMKIALRDEVLTFPMNYTWYRMEKHKAVSAEEREEVSSFGKWYMGSPMALNLSIGFTIERMRGGHKARSLSRRLAKKMGSARVKAAISPFKTKGGNRAIATTLAGKTLQGVTDRLSAMSRAKLMAFENNSVLGMLGTMGPAALSRKVWNSYKHQRTQASGGSYVTMLDRIRRDNESLLDSTKQTAKRKILSGELTEKAAESYSKTMTDQIHQITNARVRKYRDKMLSTNKFTQWWNNMVKDLKDPSMELRPETMEVDKVWGRILDSKDPLPTGRYTLGGKMNEAGILMGATTIDFGALSLSRLRDSVIKGTTKGGVGTFLHLFGLKDVMHARDSEHALIGAVTTAGGKPLQFPMAWYNETGEYTTRDIMARMMGARDYESAADKQKVDAFLDSRLKIYGKEFGIFNDRQLHEKAFLADARHGTLRMKSDDMVVQMPGGRMKVISMEKKGDLYQPVEVDVGGFNGELIEFAKFSRQHDSVPAKLINSFTGYEKATYRANTGATGDTVSVVHGPGMFGKIVDAVSAEDQRGLWYKLKNALDIGYSHDRNIFSRVASIFRKHADPRYPTTFFSKAYVGSKEWRRQILKEGEERSREDMVSFFKEQADTTMLEYWTGLVRRVGGTDEAVSVMTELGRKHSKYGMEGITESFITPDMPVEKAKTVVDDLLESLKAVGLENNPDELAKHFLHRDLRDLGDIRRMLTSPSGKRVIDVMGHISAKHSTYFGMKPTRPNKMDEYNAIALRLNTSTYQMGYTPLPHPEAMEGVMRGFGALPTPLTDAERSAWYAASHLARTYHGLASAVSDATAQTVDQSASGRIMAILDDVGNLSGATYKDIAGFYKKRKRFAPWAMWGQDHRLKWEDTQNVKTGIYMIPKKANYGLVSKEPINIGGGEEISVAKGVMDASNISVMGLFHAFNRAASEMLGIGFDETNLSTPFQYFHKMLAQRVIPFTALYMGYSVADRLADRFMDGTPFGEGLTTFGANIIAGARVGAQGFLDMTGVTGIAARMEDVMPGVMTSPFSGFMRGIAPIGAGMSMGASLAGPAGALTGGIVGSAVGALLGGGPLGVFGMWDISKNRSEVVQELLGEKHVPVRKGRWWELSSTPFEGTRVQYYRPHIYSLLRSDYKEAPGFKDSMFTEMVGHMAPDWYAMKDYYTRPYPVTAGLFSNLPVFGNVFDLITSTSKELRALTLRGIPMHQGEESPLYTQRMGEESGFSTREVARSFVDREGFFTQTGEGSSGEGIGAHLGLPGRESPVQAGTPTNYTASPMMRSSFEWGLGETVENVKDIVGIRGFIMGSTFEGMTGRRALFDYAPELASPVEIPGIQREYWDYELGGLLGMSEIIRRYINPKRNQIEIYNPIRNTMPTWLPGHDYYIDFQHGDPFTQVPMGEARLPGASYETLNDVDLTMPIVADILGEARDSQVAFFMGIPNHMAHRNRAMDIAREVAIGYREDAKRYGELLSEQRTIYNANLNASATVDAIITRGGTGGSVPVRIVPKGFAGQSDLNAFLVMSGVEEGLLIEIDPESGALSDKIVKKDVKKFLKDLKSATGAKTMAYNQIVDFEEDRKSFNLANSYSWFNRYQILADVAHYSREYREAKSIVKKQIEAGRMSSDKIAKFYEIEQQVETKKKAFDFDEYRFKDLGEGLTPYTRARDRFIEEEYSTMEQFMGSMWERATHVRNPIQGKFYHNMDALEEYERNAIYGKTIKMWQSPYEDWIKSYFLTAVGEHDPVQASVNWATAGFLIGGGPLAALASMAGGAFTSINNVSGGVFVPERTEKVRDVVAQTDAVKYAKFMKLYQETGDEQYLSIANRSVTAKALDGEPLTARRAGRSLGRPEKDYLEDIINNITRSNMSRATQLLPAPAVASVYSTIGQQGYAEDLMRSYGREQKERYIPGADSTIYSPDVPIAVPAITSFEQEGLNAHDAGYGWYSQMAQIQRLTAMGVYKGESVYDGFGSNVSMKRFDRSLSEPQSLRKALSKYGSNINIMDDGESRVEVEIIER